MAFAGNLSTLPLADVLTTLHNIHASGVLRLKSRMGSRDVVFTEGEIIGVGLLDPACRDELAQRIMMLDHASAAEGTPFGAALASTSGDPGTDILRQDAVREQALHQIYNLFAWNSADFTFQAASTDDPEAMALVSHCRSRPMRLSIQHVLMETARQQDEWTALRERIAAERKALGVEQKTSEQTTDVYVDSVLSEAHDTGTRPTMSGDDSWDWPSMGAPGHAVEDPFEDAVAGVADGSGRSRVNGPGTSTIASALGQPRQRPSTSIMRSDRKRSTTQDASTDRWGGLQPGRRIGSWELLQPLGRGGAATVWRARRADGSEAALKLVPRGDDAAAAGDALREAGSAAAVRHPHVIACLGVGEDNGYLYVATELMSRGDLAAEVAKRGGLPEADLFRLALEVARGLAAIHQAGFSHRDIKPENILLGADGRARIGDFGLAAPGSRRGEAAGTPSFMAPEALRGAAGDPRKADLYALGALIWFLAAGRPPYAGRSTGELVASILAAPPPALRSVVPAISEGLSDLVARLMAPDPVARPADATAVIDEIQALAEGPLSLPGEDSAGSRVALGTRRTALIVPGEASSGRRRAVVMHADVATSRRSPSGRIEPAQRHSTAIHRKPAPPAPAPLPAEQRPQLRRPWGFYSLLILLVLTGLAYGGLPLLRSIGSGEAPAARIDQGGFDPALLPDEGRNLAFAGDELASLAPDGVAAVQGGDLVIGSGGSLSGPATVLNQSLASAGQFSIEVVFTAGEPQARGQGRNLSLSRSAVVRNLALSQSGDALELRLRSTRSSPGGLRPHLLTRGGLVTGRRQVATIVRAAGRNLLYVDGVLAATVDAPGGLESWDPACELRLGSDPGGASPWTGTIHRITIFPRALPPSEVASRVQTEHPR